MLAVKLLIEQQAEVTGLAFESPFFSSAQARRAAVQLGVPLRVEDFTAEIMKLLDGPPHGFGSRMNPCVDCHAAMIKRAGAIMAAEGFDVVATGEVLNERPFSQNPRALALVAKLSGIPDRLLRPLSARLLPETLPEIQGIIRRDMLLGIRGRSRLPQLQLAKRYGLDEFPTPAGGCRLTDPHFSERLKELKSHGGLSDLRAVKLLKIGRHFRLPDGNKMVVGRSLSENEELETVSNTGDILLKPEEIPGPSAMLPAGTAEDTLKLAATICAAYCDIQPGRPIVIQMLAGTRVVKTFYLEQAPRNSFDIYRVDA